MLKFICITILLLITINCSNFQNETKPIYENKKTFPLLLGAITYYSDSQFSKYALDTVDLSKYAGSWFEIKRIPNAYLLYTATSYHLSSTNNKPGLVGG